MIDVLIPIYNSNKDYLTLSINSIKKQTIKNNVICILNGMDNNKNKLYRDLLQQLEVDLIVECPFQGVAQALNYGVQFTKSQFIARQDDDDISHPERLYSQYFFMRNNNIDVLGTNIHIINSSGRIIGHRRYPLYDQKCKQKLVYQTCFAHPSVMMKREFIINNPYPLTGSEDYALWLNAYNHANYANLNNYLYLWRKHPNQASSKSIPYLYLNKSIQLIKKENSIFLKFTLSISLCIRVAICLIKRRNIDLKTDL